MRVPNFANDVTIDLRQFSNASKFELEKQEPGGLFFIGFLF